LDLKSKTLDVDDYQLGPNLSVLLDFKSRLYDDFPVLYLFVHYFIYEGTPDETINLSKASFLT
jgi:hypothetical protein